MAFNGASTVINLLLHRYDAKYGQCWNRIEDFDRHQDQWQLREKSDFHPFESCSAHNDCENIDMNMFCKEEDHSDKSVCQCRNDMKWNEETLECQIYMVSPINYLMHAISIC